ncbi:hypothetical protein KVK77_01615 [Helicobacter pylori]|nr:hypothetical protein KVK77_01615 [Helicobacter pylori]
MGYKVKHSKNEFAKEETIPLKIVSFLKDCLSEFKKIKNAFHSIKKSVSLGIAKLVSSLMNIINPLKLS